MNKIKDNYLGSNIQFLLNQKNLTQSEFAKAINKNVASVNTWITRGVNPPLPCLITIAEFFNISLDELVCFDLHQGNNNDDLRKLLDKLSNGFIMQKHYDYTPSSEATDDICVMLRLYYKKKTTD